MHPCLSQYKASPKCCIYYRMSLQKSSDPSVMSPFDSKRKHEDLQFSESNFMRLVIVVALKHVCINIADKDDLV